MKKIIAIAILMVTGILGITAQPVAEFRVENEALTSSTTYEFDVYIYNTGPSSFELRAGTIALLVNPTWKNSGTIGTTPVRVSSTSELSTANQSGAISFVNATTYTGNYFRQIIGSAGAGLGTTIASGARVRCGRFRLTNSVAFSTTVAPNLAWRFNASPFAGMNYDNAGASTVLISNSVNSSYAKLNTYRIGSAWSTGSTSGGTPSTTAPSSNSVDVVFLPSSSLSTNAFTCRNLNLMNSSSLTINAGTLLSVSGSLSNSGTLTGTGADLELVGTGATANQTWSGNGATFRDVVIGVVSNTTTKTLSAPLSVSRNLQLQGTATLAAGGNLTLLSNASGTARLLELPAGADVTGNVTVQRFVPGSSGRRFRYLSAPFASGPSIANSWQQQIHITGSGTGGTICPSLTAHTNGFDATMSNAASMFTFNETGSTNTNVAGNNGGTIYTNAWLSVANTASTNLTWGTGYRVFVRGNRSQGCDLLNGTNPAPSNVTLSGTGTLKTGNASFALTYSPSNGEGWNLVGNPYACPINWDAAGWTRTNVDNMVWIFRPAGNHFSTWNGATGLGANFGSNVIESGGAFFVKANASSPVLVATEAVKTGNSPATPLFKTNIKALRVNFVKPGELADELVVAMSPEAQDGLDAMDSEKMTNPGLNIYAKDAVGNENAINTFKAAQAETVVPVAINSTFTGSHTFSFKGETEFNAYDVLLEDRFLGVIQLVNTNPTYRFDITANTLTFGENRFRLIFVNRGDFDYLKRIEGIYKNMNGVVNMYPNPTAQTTSVQVPNMSGNMAQVKVYNAVGQELMSFSSAINKGNASFEVDLGVQSSGIYFVEVTDELGKVSKGKLVKN